MNKITYKILLTFLFSSSLIISSCSEDSDNEPNIITFENGYFIINSGDLSSIYFDRYSGDLDLLNVDIYELINDETIHGQIKDFVVDTQYAYILIDSPDEENNHIEVLNKNTFEIIKKIYNGVSNGEKILTNGNKAYVLSYSPNNGYNEYVIKVIDMDADALITSVFTGCYFQIFNPFGDPSFLINNNKIYTNSLVANLISEMDLNSNTISNSYTTNSQITSMLFANNELYYSGLYDFSNGQYTGLYKVELNSGNITTLLKIDFKLINRLTFSNGLFNLMLFDSPYLSDFGTIYSWNGNDDVLFNPIAESGGYLFNRNMTSFYLKNGLIYYTYDDSRHILDISTKEFVRHTVSGPNTSKIVFY